MQTKGEAKARVLHQVAFGSAGYSIIFTSHTHPPFTCLSEDKAEVIHSSPFILPSLFILSSVSRHHLLGQSYRFQLECFFSVQTPNMTSLHHTHLSLSPSEDLSSARNFLTL